MTRFLQRGDQVVLREIWRGRIWSGRPYTIVKDTHGQLIIWAQVSAGYDPFAPMAAPYTGVS